MAINYINVNVHKIRLNIRKMRLLVARFEQSKLLKYSSDLSS